MKAIISLVLLALAACAQTDDTRGNWATGPARPGSGEEVQYVLPDKFIGTLENKHFSMAIAPAWGSKTDSPRSGLGIQDQIIYNSFTCYMSTRLIQNERMNYWYLIIEPQKTDADYPYLRNNDPQCNQLLGNFWIHHNGNDHQNLLYFDYGHPEIPHPDQQVDTEINMEIERE